MGALRKWDPAEWEKRVRQAMAEADGAIGDAAESLGVSMRTLFRWLEDPRLADVEKRGPGRPWT